MEGIGLVYTISGSICNIIKNFRHWDFLLADNNKKRNSLIQNDCRLVILCQFSIQSIYNHKGCSKQKGTCIWTCSKCTNSDSYRPYAKSHSGIYSPLIHSTEPMILLADSEGPDQTVGMCRLIWDFAVSICPKPHFGLMQPTYSYKSNMNIERILSQHTQLNSSGQNYCP